MDKDSIRTLPAGRATHEPSPTVSAVPVGIPSAIHDRLSEVFGELLGADQACCGRVTTATIEWLADEAVRACLAVKRVERRQAVQWMREDAASLNASEEPTNWKCAEAIEECAAAIESGEHDLPQLAKTEAHT